MHGSKLKSTRNSKISYSSVSAITAGEQLWMAVATSSRYNSFLIELCREVLWSISVI